MPINTNPSEKRHPLILIILDGWGYREENNHNAITTAHTPCWNTLWKNYPHCLLTSSGLEVGLPAGQMGNSEVGHMTIGAGRTIYQDLTRINQAISSGTFFSNPILIDAIQRTLQQKKSIHIAGLLSAGGVHSHEDHFKAMIELALQQGAKQVYIHAFLDGRDSPPKSAESALKNLMHYCQDKNCGKIISIIGRYFAMDRDHRWERTQKAYNLLTGIGEYHATTPLLGLQAAYERGETDEFVSPTLIHSLDSTPLLLEKNDLFICMNFRADRMRQLVQALTNPQCHHIQKTTQPHIFCVTLTNYDNNFHLPVAFKNDDLRHILGQCLSDHHLTQLRIAETEKYAHVTFFFNGGREKPFPGETRILIPSPKVATYDLKPEMSAFEMTEILVDTILQQKYDVIICNFANPDMVGHTGNLPATIQAIEVVDQCLSRMTAALETVKGEALITADHGNAEILLDIHTHQPHTAHTTQPVPFIYFGKRHFKISRPQGNLTDLAPTILYLLGIKQPAEMTGSSLITE